MEFSTAGTHMIMQQGYDPSSSGSGSGDHHQQLFAFNPVNPNPDHWRHVSLSLANPIMSSTSHQEQMFFQQQQQQQQLFQLKRSKYLTPARELLNESCNLGGIGSSNNGARSKKKEQWEDQGGASSLYSMDLLELQRRKAKLLSMLEEVYRRYRRYCDQMRAVVSSFEAVAGEGSATVYSTLASKAMSRHFRCLKDGIMRQIQATKMAMGERDAVAPGTTKGETPRLKKLEQCLRQHKAFHQSGIMECQPWRPQRGLPERSVSVLRAWLFEHFLHPYPSDVDKHILARQTGLSRSQVSNWFINARVRLWKPMVEEMYKEELKEEDGSNPNPSPDANASSSQLHVEDRKPVPGLLLNDSDSLSSIINSSNNNNNNHNPNLNPNPNPNFGVVDLDFSNYNANGVSLTLGLNQQEREGMSLSFSPVSQQSLLFSREHIDDERPVQFSFLDEEGQNLPYRNLIGAQFLHDLAG